MQPRSLCVFCGARHGNRPGFAEAAARLGTLMAEAGVTLVYGGGRVGLMGVLADSVKAAGGRVVGIIPDFLLRREVGNLEADELIVTASMHERKQRMFDLSDGFVMLPGGIGTLDETMEILTWKQLHQHSKPVVILDMDGYWRPFLALIDAVVRQGFAPDLTRQLYHRVSNVHEVLPAMWEVRVPPRGSSEGL